MIAEYVTDIPIWEDHPYKGVPPYIEVRKRDRLVLFHWPEKNCHVIGEFPGAKPPSQENVRVLLMNLIAYGKKK